MNIKTRLRLINVNYKFSQWHKEAQKIALAVVITQFILAGGYCYLELSGKMAHFEPKTSIITVVRGSEAAPETVKTAQNKDVAEVSAYTSEAIQTDSSPYITADGTNLKNEYKCIIASNDYDFGTRIDIETLGVCEVHDRMNSRYTGQNKIDVYMGNDKTRAIEFGRKELAFIVL